MLNLDTLILIRAVQGKLHPKERALLRRHQHWGIPGIVLWEIENLFKLRRIRFGLDYGPLAELLERLEIWPINRTVCMALRRLDFQSNPVDQIIAVTSLAYDVPLVTRDERILISRIVPFA